MTRSTSSRLAGIMYLAYIALDAPALRLFARATEGNDLPAKLASAAAHAPDVRTAAAIMLLTAFSALGLAVGLYGTTRNEDHELAAFAFACRAGEAVLNTLASIAILAILSVSTRRASNPADSPAVDAIADLLFQTRNWIWLCGGTLFAVGSTVFSWLLLRGRALPTVFAWLGVVGSATLVAGLPLEMAGVVKAPVSQLMWIPVAVFEITMGFWLAAKGARPKMAPPR